MPLHFSPHGNRKIRICIAQTQFLIVSNLTFYWTLGAKKGLSSNKYYKTDLRQFFPPEYKPLLLYEGRFHRKEKGTPENNRKIQYQSCKKILRISRV